ncbi:MAG: glycosyltransferase family 2 protein [Parcubacteria group bacterium]|nr:glycosyltransferase family 2 protein [Parcubacteria group bacterium]
MTNKVCVIILNWNGWRDTVTCLDSLFCSHTVPEAIVVCDNGSTDGSPEHILSWVADQKNIISAHKKEPKELDVEQKKVSFILIRNEKNLGYAAGNNVGIKYAVSEKRFQHIWLLNNDTKVQKDSLEKLLKCSEETSAGIIGATIVYDEQPNVVQCAGGCLYNPFVSKIRPIFCGQPLKDVIHTSGQPKIDYIYGASFFVRSIVFHECGLLNENFFLFYEEIDFCRRAKYAGHGLYWCKESIVRHKGSQSIGVFGKSTREKIVIANYHENLSTLIFTKTHHKKLLPCVLVCRFLGKLLIISLRKQWFLAVPLIKAYKEFWKRA